MSRCRRHGSLVLVGALVGAAATTAAVLGHGRHGGFDHGLCGDFCGSSGVRA